MKTTAICGLALLGWVCICSQSCQAGHGFWSVGVNFGGPGCYYRPYYPCYDYYYYRPYPVYVAPAPIVVQPAPVYAAPAAGVAYASPTAAVGQSTPDVGHNLELLRSPDERVRADSVMQLGRLRARAAVDPLAATLAGDASPVVRESAARALGLIGSPQAMPALQRAAQLDSDRDVRHSAQFALEVIQTKG